MPTNQIRKQLLDRIKMSTFPGSIIDVFRAADQGIDLISQYEQQEQMQMQQQQQQDMQVANTPEQQEIGLREQHAMGNTDASMAFPDVQPNQSFNTVGMKAPIDIQKIDDQGHLVESYKNVPPGIQDLPTGPYKGTVIESPPAYQTGGFLNKRPIGPLALNSPEGWEHYIRQTPPEGRQKALKDYYMWRIGNPVHDTKRPKDPFDISEYQFISKKLSDTGFQTGGVRRSKLISQIRDSRSGKRFNFPDSSVSTHLMSYGDNFVWPTLFQNEDGSWEEIKDMSKAREEAKRRGEIYKLDSEKEAELWASPDAPWKTKKFGPGYQKGGVKKYQTGSWNALSTPMPNPEVLNDNYFRPPPILRADATYVAPRYNDKIPISEEEQYVDKFGSTSGSHYPTGDKLKGNNPNLQWISGASNQMYASQAQKQIAQDYAQHWLGVATPIPILEGINLTSKAAPYAVRIPGLIDDIILKGIGKGYKSIKSLRGKELNKHGQIKTSFDDQLKVVDQKQYNEIVKQGKIPTRNGYFDIKVHGDQSIPGNQWNVQISSPVGPDDGFMQLVKSEKGVYHLDMSMPNRLDAGQAMKYLEEYIPKGSIIQTAPSGSLSLDSYKLMTNQIKRGKFSVVPSDKRIQLNMMSKDLSKIDVNSAGMITKEEADKIVKDVNKMLSDAGVEGKAIATKHAPIPHRFAPELSEVLIWKVDIPNLQLKMEYQKGGFKKLRTRKRRLA